MPRLYALRRHYLTRKQTNRHSNARGPAATRCPEPLCEAHHEKAIQFLARRRDLIHVDPMCRMFGVLASKPVALGALLADGVRSLRVLSREHGDGWGVALRSAADWVVEKRTKCAAECSHYEGLAMSAQSRLAIAHVRKRTVGDIKLTNTHPFQRGRYVLAHNGTLPGVGALAAHTSFTRLSEIEGETDSERLFVFILTHVDRASDMERGVTNAVRQIRGISDFGAASFLFSDGERMFAHRSGRTLYSLLKTDPHGGVAAMVASEPLTHDEWSELREGSLTELHLGEDAAVKSISFTRPSTPSFQGVGSVSQ